MVVPFSLLCYHIWICILLTLPYIVMLPYVDLVWSDPEEVDGWAISPRGAGYLFGAKVTHEVSIN